MNRFLGSVVLFFGVMATGAMAGETTAPVPPAGGQQNLQYSLSPHYSEDLGLSLRGALGGYVSSDVALGLLVEYGRDKREYLANSGIELGGGLGLVASLGMLQERDEFGGSDVHTVQQMEYGLSLKSAESVGLLRGFELNGYLADSDVDSSDLEAGRVYGIQLLAGLIRTDTTSLKLGGGYEWLDWDTSDDSGAVALRAQGSHQLTERLSVDASGKIGASETSYNGGLVWDLGRDGGGLGLLGLTFGHIDGRDGIEDDQRIELSWRMGFGGSKPASGDAGHKLDLLQEVLQRPSYMPQRVIAKAQGAGPCATSFTISAVGSFVTDEIVVTFASEAEANNAQSAGTWSFFSGTLKDYPMPTPNSVTRPTAEEIAFQWTVDDVFNGGDPLRAVMELDGGVCQADAVSVFSGI